MADERMCHLCSAWKSYHLEEIENFGYCTRYAVKIHAFERCETWDERVTKSFKPFRSNVGIDSLKF